MVNENQNSPEFWNQKKRAKSNNRFFGSKWNLCESGWWAGIPGRAGVWSWCKSVHQDELAD
jgi:hypothetical protein